MRNDYVTSSKKKKIAKNSMQMRNGLYWRCFFFKNIWLIEPVENAFLVVSFTQKKRHFQPSVKLWKIIKHMASMQQFLPEKLSKFNSTFHFALLIECEIKHSVRKKCGPFSPATTT